MRYLLDTIAETGGQTLSGTVTEASAMTRYFTAKGNPPGRWIGQGVHGLGMTPGWAAHEISIERVFQHGTHPLTGQSLGPRAFQRYASADARIERALEDLDPNDPEYEALRESIVHAEMQRPTRASVSGFELVFAPPKSLSVAWGLSDLSLKEALAQCHQEAMDATLAILERDYLRTRVGTDGVAQVGTGGLVAAQFDHWSNRGQDPHLHTHVLVSNRVQGEDGRWRTIDSRGALMPAVVTLSETYNVMLMDAVTQRLGWEWTETTPPSATNLGEPTEPRQRRWELATVPADLIAEFSQRRDHMEDLLEARISNWRETHGEAPNAALIHEWREQLRRDSAAPKVVLSLEDLSAMWRGRAQTIPAGRAWLDEVRTLTDEQLRERARTLLASDDLSGDRLQEVVAYTLWALQRQHSHWRRHNALTEVHRILAEVRFRSPADRDAAAQCIADFVVDAAVPLDDASQLRSAPWSFRAPDGSSAFKPTGRLTYTTPEIVAAERRLLAAADSLDANTISATELARGGDLLSTLDSGQLAAVTAIATSGRRLDLLIGAAGTGKTTTLATLQGLWQAQYPHGRVVALAPSAAAAQSLGESLPGTVAETTAKWLYEAQRGNPAYSFSADDLVLIDEAGLAGTLALDEVCSQVIAAGGKVVLVGDPLQLQAVEAGGALGMLESHLGARAATLDTLWRFESDWEALASLRLRRGDASVLDVYESNARIHYGDEAAILEGVVAAWLHDEQAGLRSIMVAQRGEVLHRLNASAQQQRLGQGLVDHSQTVAVAHGQVAGVGDVLIARLNDRRLRSSGGNFITNGSRWSLERIYSDGSAALRNLHGETLVVGADYLAQHTELGYATTAHRAQGLTTDTAHSIIEQGNYREATYVGLTRGRRENHAWVVLPAEADAQTDDPVWQERATYREVFASVLRHSLVSTSALDEAADIAEADASLSQVVAELDTILSTGHARRFAEALRRLGLSEEMTEHIIASPSWDSLAATMRRAQARGLDPIQIIPVLIRRRSLDDAGDIASVLHYRMSSWLEEVAAEGPQRLEGLFDADARHLAPDLADAAAERVHAIIRRVDVLVDRAMREGAAWLPTDLANEHLPALRTVLAYRDRWQVTDPVNAVGPAAPTSSIQREQWVVARQAYASLVPQGAPTPPASVVDMLARQPRRLSPEQRF